MNFIYFLLEFIATLEKKLQEVIQFLEVTDDYKA